MNPPHTAPAIMGVFGFPGGGVAETEDLACSWKAGIAALRVRGVGWRQGGISDLNQVNEW